MTPIISTNSASAIQADRGEELGRAGNGEDEYLHQPMDDEQQAERHAQEQGGIRRGAAVDHGTVSSAGGRQLTPSAGGLRQSSIGSLPPPL
jgi:hypothetical protein